MREIFVLRGKARNELRAFVSQISAWPKRSDFPHFLNDSEADRKRSSLDEEPEEERAPLKLARLSMKAKMKLPLPKTPEERKEELLRYYKSLLNPATQEEHMAITDVANLIVRIEQEHDAYPFGHESIEGLSFMDFHRQVPLERTTEPIVLLSPSHPNARLPELAPTRRRMSNKQTIQSLKYLSAFFRFLEIAIKSEKAIFSWRDVLAAQPTDEELKTLLDALNSPLVSLTWSIYRTIDTKPSVVRAAADHLLAYLNLIAQCGAMHALCADCGVMFIRGRGDRKFCKSCSKNHQTYQYRKQYLLQKKKEYYRRDLEKDRPFRPTTNRKKGATHGRPKK